METRGHHEELLTKLEIIGNGGWFLWKIFLLCTVPSILNGLHQISYVYLAEVPEHWCRVPELSESNWTAEEIRAVSSPGGSNQSSCEFYNWNYKNLSRATFSQAVAYVQSHEKPESVPCEDYSYDEGISSMVINYDLVCERLALKPMIQVSLSIGKFAGALLFGVLSDKFGRRFSFLLGCFLYVVSGPLVAFAVNYSMIVGGRIGLGAASSGIYHSAFVILSEIASKKHRAALVILFNLGYPVGQMLVSVIAMFCRDWRMLQIIISVPSILLFVFYWFLPESPRWLILKGRTTEAEKFIDGVYSKRFKSGGIELLKKGEREEKEKEDPEENERVAVGEGKTENEHNIWKRICLTLKELIQLLKYLELRKRLLIILNTWCVCNLCYYALALNVDNFLTNRYLYGVLTGLVEVPSYVLPLPLLKYFGRRQTTIVLFYVGGFALLTILAIPRHHDLFILVVASIGRLCASAVFAVVILHTTELFPTLLRNTAIGCCSTAGHIGSMSAPFVVDLLGAIAWYIPSTVCGVGTLIVGTMIFLLPETKNKPLPDTVDDIVKAPKNDRMGFHQIWSGS